MTTGTVLKSLIDWLHLHPYWAEIATFLFAFSESIAIIGLLIPGSIVLTAIGTLVGSGVLPVWPTFAAAILGAVLGDTFSFWLGYRYSNKILNIWPIRKYPKLIERGQAFFKRHGGKSVFIGRFAGPVRPITPLLAGTMKMPVYRFLIATSCSGIGWACMYMLPGIFLGAASLMFSAKTVSHVAILILLIIAVGWGMIWLIRKLWATVYKRFDRSLLYLWYRMQKKPSLQPLARIFLTVERKQVRYEGQFHIAILCLLTITLFIVLTVNAAQHGIVTAWNQPLYHFFRTLRSPISDGIMFGFTSFGDKFVLLPVVLLTFLWLVWQRYWREGLHWLGNCIVAAGAIYFLKLIVQIPRPIGNLVVRSGYAFPSGHTALATAVFGFLAVMLAVQRAEKPLRIYLWVWISIIIIAIGRLFLNLHWLADVVASMVLGLVVVMITTLSYHRYHLYDMPARKFLNVFLSCLIIIWAAFVLLTGRQHLRNLQPYWPIKNISMAAWWKQNNINPPYYTNRFGHPKRPFHIEWASSLASIETTLEKGGWQTPEQTKFRSLISLLSGKNFDAIIPLTSPFYQDKPWQLELIKFENNKPPLVLQLWSAHIYIDHHTPLWYGRVFYYQPLILKLFYKHPYKQHPHALLVITKLLSQYQWKPIDTKISGLTMLLIRHHQG